MLIVAFAALAIPALAQQSRRWDETDKVLAGAYTVTLALDVGQTHHALRHNPDLQESNFLGPNPSDGLLIVYNLAVWGAVMKTASLLPSRPWRKVLLAAFFTYEAVTVRNNLWLGASLALW